MEQLDKQSLEEIQKEIRAKVFERFKQQQGLRTQETELEATLEALREVTNLPSAEIQRIADEVRANYLNTNKRSAPSLPIDIQHADYRVFIPMEMERKITLLKGKFYPHAIAYGLVNTMLITLNTLDTNGFPWAMFPVMGWGIGLAIHYLKGVYFPPRIAQQEIALLAKQTQSVLTELVPEADNALWSGCLRMLLARSSRNQIAEFVRLSTLCPGSQAEQVGLQLEAIRNQYLRGLPVH